MVNAIEFQAQVLALPAKQPLRFYLIVDAAQNPQNLPQLKQMLPESRSLCLLTHAQGPDLEAAAPHLQTFPSFDIDDAAWQWLFQHGPASAAGVTLIASDWHFDVLGQRLHQLTEVALPDDEEMIFAFWDPAILGTLIGQPDDASLHVPGPVLTAHQREQFLSGITAWWYWSRDSQFHQIRPAEPTAERNHVTLPLRLTQTQVDMLVEASVPDHVIGYMKSNKPDLLENLPEQDRYPRVRKHLLEARELRLIGMRDMLDYVCAALIYGDRIYQNSTIRTLLEKVEKRQLGLTEALAQFP